MSAITRAALSIYVLNAFLATVRIYLHFLNFLSVKWFRYLTSTLDLNTIMFILCGHYHGCWWPGYVRGHGINSQCIELVFPCRLQLQHGDIVHRTGGFWLEIKRQWTGNMGSALYYYLRKQCCLSSRIWDLPVMARCRYCVLLILTLELSWDFVSSRRPF